MTAQEVQERLHKIGIDLSIQECEMILQMALDIITLAPNYSLETVVDVYSILFPEQKAVNQ